MRLVAYCASLLMILALTTTNGNAEGGDGSANKYAGLLLVATWAAGVPFRLEFRRPHPFHALAVLFVFWFCLSVVWSVDDVATLERARRMLQSLAIAVVMWDLYRTPAQLRAAVQAYVVGCYASVGWVAFNFVRDNRAGAGWDARYTASQFDPNDLAAILAIGIPLAHALAGGGLGGRPGWLAAAFNLAYAPAAVAGIVLTGSRGGLFAAAPACLFLLKDVWAKAKTPMIILAGLALCASPLAARVDLDKQIERFSKIKAAVTSEGLTGRMGVWKAAVDLAAKHPTLGVGAGGFGEAAKGYGIDVEVTTLVVHNTHLSLLTELGPLGMALYGGMVFLLARGAWRLPRGSRAPWLLTFAAWEIAVLVMNWEYRPQSWLVHTFILCGSNLLGADDARAEISPARE